MLIFDIHDAIEILIKVVLINLSLDFRYMLITYEVDKNDFCGIAVVQME